MASVSLASGYIVKPAIPHLLANSFKNLAAVSFVTDYSFKQADKLKAAAKNAASASTAAPAGGKAAAKAEVKEEVKEEEADVDMGNMFGDEYWVIPIAGLSSRYCGLDAHGCGNILSFKPAEFH